MWKRATGFNYADFILPWAGTGILRTAFSEYRGGNVVCNIQGFFIHGGFFTFIICTVLGIPFGNRGFGGALM